MLLEDCSLLDRANHEFDLLIHEKNLLDYVSLFIMFCQVGAVNVLCLLLFVLAN